MQVDKQRTAALAKMMNAINGLTQTLFQLFDSLR